VLSYISWRVDKRRVSGAVTRHLVFVLPSLLIYVVNKHRERHIAAPALPEFVLSRLTLLEIGIT
jgi:hypothetical protein